MKMTERKAGAASAAKDATVERSKAYEPTRETGAQHRHNEVAAAEDEAEATVPEGPEHDGEATVPAAQAGMILTSVGGGGIRLLMPNGDIIVAEKILQTDQELLAQIGSHSGWRNVTGAQIIG